MDLLMQLWLPILVSAVLVFVASSIIWMATPLHKKDFVAVPDEAGLQGMIRSQGLKPGQYYIPWCAGSQSANDPAFLERFKSGPWASLIVMGSAPNFGKSLGLWFLHNFILSVIVAYAAAAALPMNPGPDYLKVFQVVGAIAILAHAGSWMELSIWRGLPWRFSLVRLFDGVVYGLVTAGTFAWLWPRTVGG